MGAPRLVLALSAAGLSALAAVPPAAAGRTTSAPLPSSVVATSTGTDAVIAYYRTRIPQLMRAQHVPGVAVAVVDGSTVLWQQGFGSTDTDGRDKVTADTAFSVESMSKTFTATAVLEAAQAGRVDLDRWRATCCWPRWAWPTAPSTEPRSTP